MNAFILMLTFSLIGTLGALIGAGILLIFPKLHERLKTPLLSYAVGTLMGATFLGLLPNAMKSNEASTILQLVLAGFVGFFILEKILRIPHRHAHSAGHVHKSEAEEHARPAAILILIGDAFHNFVDGIMIAVSFLVSIPLGLVTALAVVAHEIPQELGDFVILIESGMGRIKAYWANFASALTTVAGALLTYWLRGAIEPYSPYAIALAASSFLYIATVDVAPILHHHTGWKSAVVQTAGMIIGILTIVVIHFLME